MAPTPPRPPAPASPVAAAHRPKRPRYLLRFISGDYTGKEFALADGTILYVGRNPELDIVLYDELVSREHAKIVCENKVVTITDLDSTNGTYLYAERVKHSRLKEGDRIIIGGNIIHLVSIGTVSSFRKGPENILEGGAQAVFRGHLMDIPLIDLLQMLHINKKTGTVALVADKQRGFVYLDKGAITHCVMMGTKLAPVKALYRMIAWRDGGFEFGAGAGREIERPLPIPTQTLLMQAVKHNDALAQLIAELPLEGKSLRLPRPLNAALADLEKEALHFLQLAYNAGKMTTYLDLSPASDLDAYRIAVKLLKSGYLEAET